MSWPGKKQDESPLNAGMMNVNRCIANNVFIFPCNRLSRNPTSRHALWDFIKENWDMLTKRYVGSMALLGNIVKAGVGRFTSEEMAQDCEKFFEGKNANDISRPIAQSLEVIRSNAKWVARDTEDVREWLSSKGYLA